MPRLYSNHLQYLTVILFEDQCNLWILFASFLLPLPHTHHTSHSFPSQIEAPRAWVGKHPIAKCIRFNIHSSFKLNPLLSHPTFTQLPAQLPALHHTSPMDFCINLEALTIEDLSTVDRRVRESASAGTTPAQTLSAILLSLQVLASCMHRAESATTRIILNKILARLIQERGVHGAASGDLPISLTKYNVVDVAASFQELLTEISESDNQGGVMILSPRRSRMHGGAPVSANRHLLREHNATKKLINRAKPRIRDLSENAGINTWKQGLRASAPRTAVAARRGSGNGKSRRSRSLPIRRRKSGSSAGSPAKERGRKSSAWTSKRQLREVDAGKT